MELMRAFFMPWSCKPRITCKATALAASLPPSEGDSSFAFWPRFPSPLSYHCLLPSLLFRGGCQDDATDPDCDNGWAILVYSVSSHELPSLKRKEISLLTGQYEPAGKKTCLTEYVGRPPCVNGQCGSYLLAKQSIVILSSIISMN